MSRSYDDRIVRMGFDNAKFESGAKQTMSTLDKLNEKLKLPGATEGSKNVQKSVSSVDFSSMERSIKNIEKRFSTLGVVGMNVIKKITDGITGSVAKLEQATLGQIKTGGWNRAMNIANAKFQIEGLGFAWEQVEKAVSYGVKDTAYGLDAAASAASQLAASGVDFQQVLETVNGQDLTAMHKSLRAISGVAAMTNSSYEDIARIFTTVAGNGRLMGDQLLQLSSRGMNAAAKLAETLGTTEGEIRDMVSRGQIDFQTFAFAMDNAFGDHAKEANKTFTGALGNMKAALSRVGEIFSDPIINKTNTLFISLTTRIDEFKNKLKSIKVPRSLDEIKKMYEGTSLSATAYEQILKGVGKKTISLSEDFAKMWQSGIDAFSAMVKSVDFGWFDKIVEKVDGTINKVKEFFDLIKEIYSDSAEEAADGIQDATETLLVSAEEAQAAKDIILKGMYGSGQKRVDALTEMFGGGEIGAKHAKNVQAYVDSVIAAGWDFDKASIKVEDASQRLANSQTDMARSVKKAKISGIINNTKETLTNLWNTATNIAKGAGKIIGAIVKAFSPAFKMDFYSISGGFKGLSKSLEQFSAKLIISDKFAEQITETISGIIDKIKSGSDAIKNSTPKVKQFFETIKNDGLVKGLKDTATSIFDSIKSTFSGDDGDSIFSGIKEKFSGITESFSKIFSSDNKEGSAFQKITEKIKGFVESIKSPGGLKNSFKSLSDIKLPDIDTEKIGNFINGMIDAVKRLTLKDIANIFLAYQAIVSIMKLISSMKNMTKIADSVKKGIDTATKVPASISKFFTSVSSSFKKFTDAKIKDMSRQTMPKAMLALAGSLTLVAGVILVLSHVDPTKLATASIIVVTIMGLLAGIVIALTREGAKLSKDIGGVKSLVPLVAAISVMIGTIASSILSISVATRIISKAPTEGVTNMLLVMGVLFGGLTYLLKSMSGLNAKSVLASALALTMMISSMSGMFVAMSIAVTAIKNVDNVEKILLSMFAFMGSMTLLVYAFLKDTKGFGYSLNSKAKALTSSIMSLAISMVLISAAIRGVKDVKNIEHVVVAMMSSLILIAATVWLFSDKLADKKDSNLKSRMSALTSSIFVISIAMNLIASSFKIASGMSNLETTALTMVASVSALAIMIGLFVKITDKYDSSLKSRINAFTGGVLSLAVAMDLIAVAFRTAGKTKNLETTALILVASLGAIALIIGAFLKCTDKYDSSIKQRIGMLSIAFLAIGSTMGMIAGSIKKLGKSDNIIKSGLIMVGTVLAIGELLIAFNTMTKGEDPKAVSKKTNSIAIAFTAIASALVMVGLALRIVDKIQNFEEATVALGGLVVAIIGILGIFAYMSGKSEGASGSVIAVAGAFMIIAVAMAVLANAISKLSGMSSGIIEVAIAFGIFVGVIVILSAIAAALPKFSKALDGVGKVFLYAGAAAVLVGAGIFLLCKGVQALAPAVAILSVGLEQLFTVLEEHTTAAIIVGIIIVAIIAATIIAMEKISKVVSSLVEVIKGAFSRIGNQLDKGKEKFKGWTSDMSVKGKAAVVGLITTLCAALLKAGPTVLDTIGKMLIQLLKYLGSIAGALADGLVEFIINLIDGVTASIRRHSARLAASLWGVVYAIADLLVQILGQLVYMLIAPFSEGFADELRKSITDASSGITELAEKQKKLAEEMDRDKEDYVATIDGYTKSTVEASGKFGEALDKLKSVFGDNENTVDTKLAVRPWEDSDLTDTVKSAVGDIDLSDTELSVRPWDSASSSIPGAKDILAEANADPESFAEQGEECGNAWSDSTVEAMDQPDEYYNVSEGNMDSSQQAIVDSEDGTVTAVREHFNEPAKQTLREGRRGMYEGAEYAVAGATDYLNKAGSKEYTASWVQLAKAGIKSFDAANETASPSKLYYRSAEYLVAGLVNGINQNTDDATGAMGNLADAIFAAFGDPIGYVSKIMSGELVYDPSIRPVFDGSNVYSGAASINSMLSGQTMTVAGFSGKLATDIGQLDKSNLDVVNEIKALREDMAALGEEIADMQIVMDTGALVGATVGPMDKALGARTIRAQRG